MYYNALPDEFILMILEKLNAKDSFNFSFCCKKLWNVATLPKEKPYVLENNINAIKIRQLKCLVIGNTFYESDLIVHVLRYALNLKKVILTSGKNYNIAFLQLFTKITKSCLLLVPLDQLTKTKIVIEDSENNYLTVGSNDAETSVDMLKTPEEVDRKVRVYKLEEKLKFWKKNPDMAKMKPNLGHVINAHLNRLINTNEYNLAHKILAVTAKAEMSKHQAYSTIYAVFPKFIESVAILEKYWFMCTSFCCFIHQRDLDDCADKSRVGFQSEPVAFIRKKTRTGVDYFEYTIRFGNFELLATSGFFGFCESSSITPFFGSSLQHLPNSVTDRFDTISSHSIFLTKIARPYITNARLLNQYVKYDSSKQWMFISQKFRDKGYEPAHPLTSDFANPATSVASVILGAFVYQSLDRKKLNEKVEMMKKKKISTKAAKLVLQYAEDFRSRGHIDFGSYGRVELKKDMLVIYEGCISSQLKSMNKKLFIEAKKEYEASKMDLFNDSSE